MRAKAGHWFGGVLAIVATCTNAGCNRHAPTQEWHTYAPEGEHFRVEMPGVPELGVTDTAGFLTHNVTVRPPHRIYLFSFIDLPKDKAAEMVFGSRVEEALEAVRASFSQRVGVPCERDASRPVQISGHEAVEGLIKCGPDARSRIRIVNATPRMYQLIVSGSVDAVNDATANRFLESLRIEEVR